MSEKSNESDVEFDNIPPEIINSVANIIQNFLPQKSKKSGNRRLSGNLNINSVTFSGRGQNAVCY